MKKKKIKYTVHTEEFLDLEIEAALPYLIVECQLPAVRAIDFIRMEKGTWLGPPGKTFRQFGVRLGEELVLHITPLSCPECGLDLPDPRYQCPACHRWFCLNHRSVTAHQCGGQYYKGLLAK